MRPRTRHPRLAAAACKIYRLVIAMYPGEFKRDFGPELAITFRNRVEDVLDDGGVMEWLGFIAHIASDSLRTGLTLVTAPESERLTSLLGLREGYAAQGAIDPTRLDVMFAAAGFVVACAGYTYFAWLPSTLT
jgi:hypothetical protein